MTLISLFLVLLANTLCGQENKRLVILHTNDTHSQVEPSEKRGFGGYAYRMGVIDSIRKEEQHTLLLDAGDFFQGTPYFNFFRGEIEIEAMNKMKYDATILGNHEFDNGMDSLAKILKRAKFPILNANYGLENTVLEPYIRPYIIKKINGLKVGIFGLGVNPAGLILQDNYKGMSYHDPIQTAIKLSDNLKNKEKCDLVICVSHLGAKTETVGNPTDFDVAKATTNLDIIISGHSHQVIVGEIEKNAQGNKVVISQMGKSGFYLGKIELTFERE